MPNCFFELTSYPFYTGMYYLRTKAAASAIQFTVDKSKLKAANGETNGTEANGNGTAEAKNGDAEVDKAAENMATLMCSIQNKDDCISCGS